jgi:hypothetical protein
MKQFFMILTIVFCTAYAWSQESVVTVSGGYSFANIEDTDLKTSGWRINGSYEFNPLGGEWAYGISMGYIDLKGSIETLTSPVDYRIQTMPIYFAPKYLFGNNTFKGFIKGALGFQKSWFERKGNAAILTDVDMGVYVGGGVGASYNFNEQFFLNLEYELAWMTNSFYKDGLMNSAMVGVGFRF